MTILTLALCGAIAGVMLWLVNEYVLRAIETPLPWEHGE